MVLTESQLRPGDVVLVEAGQIIPGDGEIIEGVASVNERAITGESAPVIRESGGDRSAVTGGTTVLSDWLIVRITTQPGQSFLDRMIGLVEGARRKKTPNELAQADRRRHLGSWPGFVRAAMKDLLPTLRPAVVALLVFTGLLGVLYPVLVGGIARAAFPRQATGSMIHDATGTAVGSELVGQPFDDPAYFWSRPSAVGASALTSGGTNQGPSGFVGRGGVLGPNPALVAAVRARIEALRAPDPGNTDPVPVDLVTASGSGLDPHISPAAAYYQARRVARARHLDAAQVIAVIDPLIEERTLGILGERRINVVRLNRALDLEPRPPPQPSAPPR